MILDCIEWRRTVEDVGIEELYRSIDPFDVRSALSLSFTLFLASFEAYLTSVVIFFPHSFPDGRVSLSAGQWDSIRYAPSYTQPMFRHLIILYPSD